jgi:hypothetical protein
LSPAAETLAAAKIAVAPTIINDSHCIADGIAHRDR